MAVAVAGDGAEVQDKIMSLPQLQSLMKKDPEAYEVEFDQQWKHFASMMEIFKLKPQKPNSNFGEQVMFLAHVAPSFPGKNDALPSLIIGVLDEHYEVMHSSMRQTLVHALILLRNRNQFPCIRTLPLYFKLFNASDKGLRTQIFAHIVKDISQMNVKGTNQKSNKDLRDLFFARLKDNEAEVSRRACAVFISLYRKNIWRDAHVVNLMSAGLVHPDLKISAALAHLFLGNKTKGLEGILEDSDNEADEEVQDVVQDIVGAKKTARREKRLKRAKRAAQKAVSRNKSRADKSTHISFVAIDLLHDPQTLAERLLQRISKSGEPFHFRLLLLHLTCRLVSRHTLLLPNLYPYMLKYLLPAQKDVTQVLACLVEACHMQVPPDDIRPVVLHVMKTFVNEVVAAEVIEVGLNGIREVCARSVNILNEEELADLAGFRKFKNKGVQMAAKGLINTYREVDPQLLHRSLRGREATMAISRGDIQAPEYGMTLVSDTIDGLDLLVAKKMKKRSADDGEAADGEEDAKADKDQTSEFNGKQMMSEQVLSSDDFKRLRKLRLQKSVELQLGRKRKAVEISDSSDSEDEEDSDEEGSDGERGLPGRMPGAMSGAELRAAPKKAKTKAQRLAQVHGGRTDYTEKLLEKRKARKGGKTNNETKRNKPLIMTMDSFKVRKKKAQTAREKTNTMKKHIKTLQKTANHQKIRRK
mmetsp:Transcript_143594/g.459317  ORF Transcript_143594/g.459317 Transcript_143594/m.459317 type:complete len:700 (+) Transcript_143594:91-2190(+)